MIINNFNCLCFTVFPKENNSPLIIYSNANRICNLETLIASQANKEILVNEALNHNKFRQEFFKNVTIEWDKQNKHVPGKHNYEFGKSIFTHKVPQDLLNKYAGTGTPVGTPGTLGYKEMVDFNEVIGIVKSIDGKIELSTTRGTIHYSKKGAHIVLANPKN